MCDISENFDISLSDDSQLLNVLPVNISGSDTNRHVSTWPQSISIGTKSIYETVNESFIFRGVFVF